MRAALAFPARSRTADLRSHPGRSNAIVRTAPPIAALTCSQSAAAPGWPCSRRTGIVGHGGHLRAGILERDVSAPIRGARAASSRSRTCCGAAGHRRHAGPDRRQRGRRARARNDAAAADRGRQPVRRGRVRQRPPRLGGARDGRRSARSRTSAHTGSSCSAPGWTEAVLDPGVEDWAGGSTSSAARPTPPMLRRRRVRLEDKGAIVAFHWRGAPDEEAARAAIDAIAPARRGGGSAHPLGTQGARGAPAGARSTRAPASSAFLSRRRRRRRVVRRRRRTDLDAFRALDAAAAGGPKLDAHDQGRCRAPTRGRPRSPARPTSWSTDPRASRELLVGCWPRLRTQCGSRTSCERRS